MYLCISLSIVLVKDVVFDVKNLKIVCIIITFILYTSWLECFRFCLFTSLMDEMTMYSTLNLLGIGHSVLYCDIYSINGAPVFTGKMSGIVVNYYIQISISTFESIGMIYFGLMKREVIMTD